jgi:hypothetical protein
MIASSAPNIIEGNKVAHKIEVSWNHAWSLTSPRIYFRFQGIADVGRICLWLGPVANDDPKRSCDDNANRPQNHLVPRGLGC